MKNSITIKSIDYIENKIKTLEEINSIVKKLKQENKVIVTNNGSYDIVHVGHIISLYEAKKQGDILIVGLNSDVSIKSYKGEDRPINPQDYRLRVLAALNCVDYIFTFDETVPMAWLEQIKPDIHTNGAEYTEDCIEKDTVEKNGGKIFLLPMVEGVKTSILIDKILKINQK